ncbi:MAG: hypothetical protein AMJ79_03595 [Phycisphaerae bacterium SM23_30]|nr:MAG: hypothetical protein AMJ79_03595 [Phycisphaerae bacterium SM23_30]
MSPLTKVLALLVSVLAIFLCGVVVVYVTNTENFKQKYEDQRSLTTAAQEGEKLAQNRAQGAKLRYEEVINRQNEIIKNIGQLNDDWARQLQTENREKLDALREKQTAMDLSDSLSKMLEQMRATNEFIQEKLELAQRSQLRAEAKVATLEQQQNQLLAEAEELKTINRQNLEYIQQLENENKQLRQQLQQGGGLISKPLRPGSDRVSDLPVGQTRQPLRGEILEVKEDLASISIGASSGVAKGQEFNVLRLMSDGQIKYMGKLTINYVEPEEAVGRLSGLTGGVILKGDRVSTDFR